ncbi:MAG: hypothetical protein ACTSRG_01110 [Candidatus Helarchaeota archaeon]
MKTGVFFNKILVGQEWPIIGNKWIHYPAVMENVLKYDNVTLYESKPVSENLLKKVHSERVINELKNSWYYEGAAVTIGGMVTALEKIWTGELTNALNFMVAAGHHASPDSAWGGTYASITGPAIYNLRQKFPETKRFAIIDTDSHCGDGTRNMFFGDKDVFHACFCSSDEVQDDGTKICVNVGWRTNDEDYLKKVENHFIQRVKKLKPDLIIHILGHDTCLGDYGDRGVTKEFFLELVKLINEKAAKPICNGRYAITTMGGDSVEVADYIFPNIIKILSGH